MDTGLVFAVGFGAGAIFGIVVALILNRQSKEAREKYESQLIDMMKGKFSTLSDESLKKSQARLVSFTKQNLESQTNLHTAQLDTKKELIDQQLEQMGTKLGQVGDLIAEFEKERENKLGALGQQLENLTRTSTLIQQALADNRSRGQWGERIADDILRISGFVEGVNYQKQATTGSGKRPDFTFFLPNGLTVNMDSKFPLTNYLSFLEAEADSDKEKYRKQFLKDANDRVKEIVKRDYINPEQNTVDIALVFIPNEQIYRFIHENDDSIIDNALENKIVVCSPLTLYIVLAVLKQAAQNFQLEQSSRDVLMMLQDIKKQWGMFIEQMEKLGGYLHKASETYEKLLGVRKRQLDRLFRKLDNLVNKYDAAILTENASSDTD